MIQCDFFICAEQVILDKLTNRVSAINLLDDRKVESLPFLLERAQICAFFKKEAEEQPKLTLLVKNNATVLHERVLEENFAPADKKIRLLLQVRSIVIEEEGELAFSFLQGEKEVGIYRMNISLREKFVLDKTEA